MNNTEKALKYFKSRKAMMLADQVQMYEDAAIEALEKKLNDGWIPTSERLPDDDGYLSLYVTIGYKETGYTFSAKMHWKYGKFIWFNGKRLSDKYEIVAWMHEKMPEPYKEGNHGQGK